MNIPEEYKPWHEFMNANHCLIWDQYGYWHEKTKPCDWFTREAIANARAFASTVVEPDIRLIFEVSEDGRHGEWATVDDANKIVYFHNRVKANPDRKYRFNAMAYMQDRHATHRRLYGGIIEALLTYKATGTACLPDWNTNESDRYGYKDGDKNLVPRVHEVKARS